MSVLRRFLILFESDASDVKRGAKEAEKATKELDSSLKNVDASVNNIASSLASLAAVGTVVAGLISAVAPVRELGNIAQEIGVNVELLDAWGNAVSRAGGSARAFQSSLSNLRDNFGLPADEVLNVLPELADALQKMNDEQARFYGRTLGIDAGTIFLLRRGSREVSELVRRQRELGTVTSRDVEITREFHGTLNQLQTVVRNLGIETSMPFIPPLTRFFRLVSEQGNLIQGGLLAISIGVSAFGLAALAARPQLLAITAALTAFALAYDEVKTAIEGGDTLIMPALRFLSRNAQRGTDDLALSALKLLGIGQAQSAPPSVANSNSVNVGDVTINTQSTDAEAIAQEIPNVINRYAMTNAQFTGGVKI